MIRLNFSFATDERPYSLSIISKHILPYKGKYLLVNSHLLLVDQ